MVRIARTPTRRGRRTERSPWLVITVAVLAGATLIYYLHRNTAPQSDGEGGHRYRQTEEAADASTASATAATEQQQQQQDEAAAQQQLSAGEEQVAAAQQAQQAAADACHHEPDAEYEAERVISWGADNKKESWGECCAACQQKAPDCNVWVFCDHPQGCAGNRTHKECWLKGAKHLYPLEPRANRRTGSGWVSGAIYTEAEKAAALQHVKEVQTEEEAYLAKLRANESLPLVFLDVEIKKKPVGRIEMVLFPDVSPRAAENFRQLCTGESGSVPDEEGREGRGKKRHFKGAFFYRIIHQFIDQTGVETESVFGGQFKDDPGGLKLKHERKGLLSMANMGPNTNTAHFSIMMAPAHHLDGSYTIFGQVVSGFEVMDAINIMSKGRPENTATQADGAQIVDSGQIRKGSIVPDLTLGL